MVRTAKSNVFPLVFLILLWLGVVALPAQAQRTVTPNEHGSIFRFPVGGTGGDWSVFGAYVGTPHYDFYARMAPDALKIRHGRFHQFCLNDDTTHADFPYSELKAFEAREVAAGRAPIFITAQYKGKTRPVYFTWSLGIVNGRPTKPAAEWRQAVHVTDDRFLRFWIDYVKSWQKPDQLNQWQGVDEGAFMYSLYGVIDDDGNYVTGVRWDRPFAQNNEQFLRSIRTFFERLHTLAPEIKVICNMASIEDWSRFPYIYAYIDGVMQEDIHPRVFINAGYNRLKMYNVYNSLQWMATQNRVGLLRSSVLRDNTTDLRTSLVAYALNKGYNFFYAPYYIRADARAETTEMPQADYTSLKAAIGEPVQTCQSTREPNSPNEGYRLYSRETDRGIVYMNVTGKTKVIPLDPSRQFIDWNGIPITTLTLLDGQGDFARFAP